MQLHSVFLSSYYALKDVNWEVGENFCQKRKVECSVFNLLIFKFQKLSWTGMNIGKCLLNLILERNKFSNNLYSNSYIQLHAVDLLWDPRLHTFQVFSFVFICWLCRQRHFLLTVFPIIYGFFKLESRKFMAM